MNWEVPDTKTAAGLKEQLIVEVGPEHALFGRLDDLQTAYRSTVDDDVLFLDRRSNQGAVLVHLVWTSGQSTNPDFPFATDISDSEVAELIGTSFMTADPNFPPSSEATK